MCGIGGIAGGARPDEASLAQMAAAMAHRGPDGQGVWAEEGIGFAFRRLAIIDLDERSNQPLHFERWHLVFNGEIYNYVELRDELSEIGHRFVTEGDGEVLLHAWAQWGESTLDRLNGMFAFAIWDSAERSLDLATDPFAEKPVFITTTGERLVFASDIRALMTCCEDVGAPDEEALAQYLALGTLPELPRTFFAGVQRLPGSHRARWQDGALQISRYWTPKQIETPSRLPDAAAALAELLTDSVRLRLRSDVPVGTSLSGGIDSSAIVGLSAKLAGDHRRHAFTARFPGFERDEWAFAHEAAQAAGVIEHHAVEPTADDLLTDLAALVRDQEEPFISTSIYAQWRVMKAARAAGVVVLLDGQGADELFGGYAGIAAVALRSQGVATAVRGLARAPELGPAVARAFAAGHVPAALARSDRRRHASPYVTAELADVAARNAVSRQNGGDTPLQRELLAQSFTSSLPHLLRYADRDSMAQSREVRLPFLDRRLAEFALSLPAGFIYDRGVSKLVLREAVRSVVPASILERRDKVGFETPERAWLRTPETRARFAEILLDRGALTSDLLDRQVIERDVGGTDWGDSGAIWRAVNAEIWLRTFSRPAAGAWHAS